MPDKIKRRSDKFKNIPLEHLTGAERDERDEAIAERGAYHALAVLGLNDESAVEDIRDIRALLKGYRIVKSAFWTNLLRMLGLVAAAAVLGYMVGRQRAAEIFNLFVHTGG